VLKNAQSAWGRPPYNPHGGTNEPGTAPGEEAQMNIPKINQVIGGKRYNTETATELASDSYWDGHNWERHGRNQWLMRAPKGSYFVVYGTCWQGERDRVEPLTQGEAITLFETLPEKEVDFEQAFPGVEVEEA
jgi:hypothetical protein